MLNEKMEKALNEQINRELYSSYLYLSMGAYSSSIGLSGFTHWFKVQVKEETIHGMKIFDYINRQGGRVRLKEIKEPPVEFGTPIEMFRKTLQHEQFITRSINDLVDLARSEKDETTASFLQWYVEEQVEEEENDKEIIDKLKIAGENKEALSALDAELAKRLPPKDEEESI
ncbi:ferritin [Methanosarcina sp. WWM596]|uniref:ferritin n=1 Tax=Methanosarcina sp. WWM596 TaxID=1434103 RepID=UPI00061607AA|nr:ferritin [Methanosarcina sp. WWM596]AKB20135.1 Ferritin-like protein 2 [Methanosarcina sp. WWM596]